MHIFSIFLAQVSALFITAFLTQFQYICVKILALLWIQSHSAHLLHNFRKICRPEFNRVYQNFSKVITNKLFCYENLKTIKFPNLSEFQIIDLFFSEEMSDLLNWCGQFYLSPHPKTSSFVCGQGFLFSFWKVSTIRSPSLKFLNPSNILYKFLGVIIGSCFTFFSSDWNMILETTAWMCNLLDSVVLITFFDFFL